MKKIIAFAILIAVMALGCQKIKKESTAAPGPGNTYGFFTNLQEQNHLGSFLQDSKFKSAIDADDDVSYVINNDQLSIDFNSAGRLKFRVQDAVADFSAWNSGIIVHFTYRIRDMGATAGEDGAGLRFEVSALRDGEKVSDSDALVPDSKNHEAGIWHEVSIPLSSSLAYDNHLFDFSQFEYFCFRSKQDGLKIDLKNFYVEVTPVEADLSTPTATQK